jgi:alkylation response protein AidB-like acyl-CoA dehydrogenase
MMSGTITATLKGGEFLIREVGSASTFIPEEFTEEHRMMAAMAEEFLQAEVYPNLDRIDAQENGLMVSLMDKAGTLGLLGISVPEEYGGFGKDFITSMLMTEVLGGGHSFAVAMAAHTGIGTLPILYFGNKAQKDKYLPKLASGEWKASYCLTEPGSGSDALAAKTKAILSADGKHYVLNGQKMWITNAGFADLFIVFAQVDGDKFTGFIVEKSFSGISLHRSMEINSPGLLLRNLFRASPWVKRNIKWESKVLQPDRYFLVIAWYRLKIFWEKLAKAI